MSKGTPATGFPMPWYRSAATVGDVSSTWAEAHPLHPLVPLRGASGEDEMAGAATGPERWAPAAEYRDRPPTAAEWRELCRRDPQLVLGVRLGWNGPGVPWFLELVVTHFTKAKLRLREVFGIPFRLRPPTASWTHNGPTHFLFLGDDRLADLGLVDVSRRIGPVFEYPGLVVRLGDPADLAASLAIPPWLPSRKSDKKQRHWQSKEKVCSLPISFYEELSRLAEAAGGRGTPGADPRAAGPIGSRIEARAGDSPAPAGGQVNIDRTGAGVRVPGEALPTTPDVLPPAEAGEPADDLATLAAGINQHHRRAASSALEALEGARRSGELLLRVKARLKHGQFRSWIEEHCEFGDSTAASYMRIAKGWEKLVSPNVQGVAPLSLGRALEMLARPRPVAPELGPPTARSEPRGPRRSRPSDPGPAPADRPIDVRTGRVPPVDPIRSHPAETPDDEPGDVDRIDPGHPTSVELPPAPEPLAPPRTFGVGPTDAVAVPETSRACPPVAGPSPAGTAGVTSATQAGRRAGDRLLLARLKGIRARLAALGNTAGFDRDATAWRLLRPVAGEFLERGPWSGEGDGRPPGPIHGGLLAPAVARLARARPPAEWTLCPDCEGAGRAGTDEGVCPLCSGRGYQIVE